MLVVVGCGRPQQVQTTSWYTRSWRPRTLLCGADFLFLPHDHGFGRDQLRPSWRPGTRCPRPWLRVLRQWLLRERPPATTEYRPSSPSVRPTHHGRHQWAACAHAIWKLPTAYMACAMIWHLHVLQLCLHLARHPRSNARVAQSLMHARQVFANRTWQQLQHIRLGNGYQGTFQQPACLRPSAEGHPPEDGRARLGVG